MAKTIVVTGASKGIGLAIARRLVADGHTVVGTSRNPARVGEVGFPLLALDVLESESLAGFVPRVLDAVGRIDVLVNNAGFDLYGAAEETSPAELAAQMDTNFSSITALTQAVLPVMRQQGNGKMINMSSIGGLVALPYNSAYAASKFALEGYSEALRLELLEHNIWVSLVEPGAVRTDTLDTSIQQVSPGHPLYARARAAMVDLMRQSGRNSSVTPEQVAGVVAQIVTARRPRLRYPVGALAQSLPMMKAVLPQAAFEWFVTQQFLRPVQAEARTMEEGYVG